MCARLASAALVHAQAFGPVVRLSHSPQVSNQPDVAAHGDQLVAVWQKEAGHSRVGWAYSTDGGGSWTDGGELPVPVIARLELPALCSDAAGNFYVVTLPENWTISVMRGRFQGSSFLWQSPVNLVPRAIAFEYDYPRIACDPERGYLYVTASYVPQIPGHPRYQTIVTFIRSTDGGATWSAPQFLSDTSGAGARPVVGPAGEVYVVWHDYGAGRMVARRSADFGQSFGPLLTVSSVSDNPFSTSPGWGGISDDVYHGEHREHPIYIEHHCFAFNYPSVAVDCSTGPNRGKLYVAWADAVAGSVEPAAGYTYEREPNDSYATANPIAPGQEVFGRMLSADYPPYTGDCDYFTFEATAGTTLALGGTITSTDFPPPLPFDFRLGCDLWCGADPTLFQHVGCALLAHASLQQMPPLVWTVPAAGRYYLLLNCSVSSSYSYALRLQVLSPSLGGAARDHRDVVLVSSSDGGQSWSAKMRVNDDPPRYDNSFPELAVDGLGQLHVTWYDRRDARDACPDQVQTYWTYSTDGGTSFVPSQPLDELPSLASWAGQPEGWRVGDHMALLAEGTDIHALWTRSGSANTDVYGVTLRGVPTGIAVSGFEANVEGPGVRLSWVVSDGRGITGFRLYRAQGEEQGFAPLSSELRPMEHDGEYQQVDGTVEPGESYRYRLEVVRPDGRSDWEGPVAIFVPAGITRLAWARPVPNPFGEAVSLTLRVARSGSGTVAVFDVSGHQVASLCLGAFTPGEKHMVWDGRDGGGRLLPAGVYWLSAEQGSERSTERVVRMR